MTCVQNIPEGEICCPNGLPYKLIAIRSNKNCLTFYPICEVLIVMTFGLGGSSRSGLVNKSREQRIAVDCNRISHSLVALDTEMIFAVVI